MTRILLVVASLGWVCYGTYLILDADAVARQRIVAGLGVAVFGLGVYTGYLHQQIKRLEERDDTS